MKLNAKARLSAAMSYAEYFQQLTDLGIAHIGSGKSADVFQHPTYRNIVVKLAFDDPMYSLFYRFCDEHPSNRWLPKFFGAKSLTLDGKKVVAYFSEKLRPATRKDLVSFLASVGYISKAPHPLYGLSAKDWARIATTTRDAELRSVALYFKQHSAMLDLHNDNLMLRGTQLVFNDPFA